MENKSRLSGLLNIRLVPLIGVIIIVILLAFAFSGKDDVSVSTMPTFVVRKGPLRISVTETGSIEAREKIIVKSEVEGKTSVISLVDEGAKVKKGDLLVELDSSALLDLNVDQEIKVQNTEAAFVSARENLAVIKNQAQSDVDKAQLTYDFAVLDLKKYCEGEYPNQLKEAESRITLAEEEVARAKEKLEWSKKLYAEQYISQTELQADELSEKKKMLDLELAKNDLDLLTNFTHKRNLAQRESDVSQAEMALERTRRKAKADIVQADANLKAKESEFKRQQDKLEKTKTQIEKTKIYAPVDGVAIYATSSSSGGPPHMRRTEPLEEGQMVRERQDLIHLPTSAGYNAEIGVYEASLDKVRKGFPAIITVDSLPGEQFTGRVKYIAPFPDARSAFLNPNLKIYSTTIEIDTDGKRELLRAGMNCTAEIIVEQYKEAVYIPVQAVIRVGGRPTVYVIKGDKLESREVELGLDNNRMIRVISGLEPGEIVSLAPPLTQAAVEEPVYEDEIQEVTPGSGAGQEKTSGSEAGPVSGRQGSGQSLNRPQGQGSTPMGSGGRQPGGNFLTRFDKDNDGRVSKDEFTGPSQFFGMLDRDGDGFVSKGEIPTGAPQGGNLMGRFDRDGDGQVSKEEFTGPSRIFERLDRDGDGLITKDEIPSRPPSGGGQGMGFGGQQGEGFPQGFQGAGR